MRDMGFHSSLTYPLTRTKAITRGLNAREEVRSWRRRGDEQDGGDGGDGGDNLMIKAGSGSGLVGGCGWRRGGGTTASRWRRVGTAKIGDRARPRSGEYGYNNQPECDCEITLLQFDCNSITISLSVIAKLHCCNSIAIQLQ